MLASTPDLVKISLEASFGDVLMSISSPVVSTLRIKCLSSCSSALISSLFLGRESLAALRIGPVIGFLSATPGTSVSLILAALLRRSSVVKLPSSPAIMRSTVTRFESPSSD